MAHGALQFDWKSYPVTTDTGYQIVVFHITSQTPPAQNKGPVLLIHGMFSSPEDFLAQSDLTQLALPL